MNDASRSETWNKLSLMVQETADIPALYSGYEKIGPQHIPFFLLALQGFTKTEIAEITGFARRTVNDVMRSVAGMKLQTQLYSELGYKNETLLQKLESVAPEALETAVDVMRTGRDDHRLKAALSILDRAGASAVEKRETVARIVIEDSRADLIAQALFESDDVGDGKFEIIEIADESR